MQLAKCLHVLYAKPSNKMYLFIHGDVYSFKLGDLNG